MVWGVVKMEGGGHGNGMISGVVFGFLGREHGTREWLVFVTEMCMEE